MTLDEFIDLQKVNLEKYRIAHIRWASEFYSPTDREFYSWEESYKRWANMRDFSGVWADNND